MSLFKSCHRCGKSYDDCNCDMFKGLESAYDQPNAKGFITSDNNINFEAPIDLDSHYKTGNIEPFDVMEDMGILEPFCLGCIIKYAMRCQHKGSKKKDLLKIAEYANKLASKL